MALQDVGVVFISKGFQNFISNLGKANRSITDFGNMTKNKIQALRILNDTAVILSNDFKKMQTSADRVAISQQRTAQSANYLKTAQEKVKISANNATSSYNKWQKSINDASVAASRAAVNIKRLEAIDKLNDALVAGTIDLEQYSQAALATNNQLRMIGDSGNSAASSITNITKSIGSSLAGLGGIFSSVSSFGNIGMTIGTAIGTIFPVIGNAIGGIAGYVLGALAGLGAGILKWFVGLAVSIGRAIINLGKKIINWIGSIFKSILGAIKGFLGQIFNLLTFGIFQSGWNNLGNTIVSSMLKFEILKQAIRKIVNEIKEFSSAAIEGAKNLQTYTARLNFLINSQVVMADKTIAVADAWSIASDEAQRLLTWIQKLSLSSPMKVEDIQETVSMAIAMGWTVDAAKKLTLSILDYTAAVGLSSQESERIIYNFAQMKNQGKVTGTELRDLGRGAFIPINKVLEIMYEDLKKSGDGMKYASMSFEEFRKQAAAGQVDVEGFFTAFEEFVGTYMPGAMEKMNYTFNAVVTRLHNLFNTLLGWDVLGPLIVTITKPIDNLIKKLSTDAVITNAKRIGVALASMFTSIKEGFSYVGKAFGALTKAAGISLPSIRQVVMAIVQFGLALKEIGKGIGGLIEKIFMPFARNIRAKYGKTFSSMRNDFFSWGANLILSLAEGMMRAAASALTAVMRAITKLLTFWLKGHSPPRVAPDIGEWGAKTIDEYYGGFTEPDPAVVNKAVEDVKDTTKDIVETASNAISMPNLNFGAISMSLHTFSQADFEALDSVQSGLKEILSTLVNLGQISSEVSGQMFADISSNLINAWGEFNKTGQISAGIFDQLRSLGGVFGTELAELLDLQLQLAVAVERTAEAQKAYDEAVKASVRAETKVNRMIKDYNNLLRKGADRKTLKSRLKMVNATEIEYAVAKKAEETRKTELDMAQEKQKALEDSVKLQETLIKQMTELVQAQKEAAGAAGDMADSVDQLAAEIGALGFDVEPPWTDADLQSWINTATSNFSVLWDDISDRWNETWSGLFIDTKSDFQDALSKLEEAFAPAVAKLKTIWDEFAGSVGLPLSSALEAIWEQPTRKTVTSAGTTQPRIPKGQPNAGLPDLSYVLNPQTGQYEKTTVANTFVDKFYQTIQEFGKTIKEHEGIKQVLMNIGNYVLTKIADFMETLSSDPTITGKISGAINSVLDFIGGIISNQMPTLTLPGGEVATMFGPPQPGPVSRIVSNFATLFGSAIKGAADALIADGTLTTIGAQIGEGLWNGIKSALFPKGWFKTLLLRGMGAGPAALTDLPDVGSAIINSDSLNAGIGFSSIFNPTQSDLNDATAAGTSIGTNILSGIQEGMKADILGGDYSTIVKNTQDALNAAYDAKSPAKTMYPVGNNLSDGIAEGIKEQINVIKWIEKLQPLIDAVKNVFGITADGPSTVFDKIGQTLMNSISDGLKWVIDIAGIVGGSIYTSFEKIIKAARDALGLDNQATNPFYLMGQDMIQGLIDGFVSKIPYLITEWNSKVVELLPEQMQDEYLMDSPSKLFEGFGKNIVAGLALGLSDFSTVIEDLTAISPLKLSPTVPMNATVSAPPIYGGTTVSFGDTYIQNDMDWAVFKSRVQRAMTER